MDKKSSGLFKVYDFDSSEDEPLSAKTDKKRVVGRTPNQAPVGVGDPIAAHFSNKMAAKQLPPSTTVGRYLSVCEPTFLNLLVVTYFDVYITDLV